MKTRKVLISVLLVLVIFTLGNMVKFFYGDDIKGFFDKKAIENYVESRHGNEFRVVDYRLYRTSFFMGIFPTVVLYSNGKLHFQVYMNRGGDIADFFELGKKNYDITQKFLSEISLSDDVMIELAYVSEGYISEGGFDSIFKKHKVYTPKNNEIYDKLQLHIFLNPEGEFNPENYYYLYDEVYLKSLNYPIGWVIFYIVNDEEKKINNITDVLSASIPDYDNDIYRKLPGKERIVLTPYAARGSDGKMSVHKKKKFINMNFVEP